jgi:hypothetical protein
VHPTRWEQAVSHDCDILRRVIVTQVTGIDFASTTTDCRYVKVGVMGAGGPVVCVHCTPDSLQTPRPQQPRAWVQQECKAYG